MLKQFAMYKEYEGCVLINNPEVLLWSMETDGDNLEECLNNVQLNTTDRQTNSLIITFSDLTGEDKEKIVNDITRIVKLQAQQDSKKSDDTFE